MKIIVEKIKKIAAGSLVALFAISIAAATNGENKSPLTIQTEQKAQAGMNLSPFIVNFGGSFEPLDNATPELNCKSSDSRYCAYLVTEDGMDNIPEKSNYTSSEIDDYVASGWLEAHPQSIKGLYDL